MSRKMETSRGLRFSQRWVSGLKSSGMEGSVVCQKLLFTGSLWLHISGLLDTEDDGNMTLQNICSS